MIANVVLFQLGWFASVLGAARQVPWLGVVVVGVVLLIHLVTKGTPRESLLIGASAAMGVLMDSLLLHSGLVTYASPTSPDWLAPAWIVGMWANLAITLRHSLSWLSRRAGLAAVLGAVLGPIAYMGAARLGAVELGPPLIRAALALGVVWGVALPALFWMSEELLGAR